MAIKTDILKAELRLRSVTKGRRSEWKDLSFIQLINYSINQLFEKGHEHLPWFGLVNMNARLYDPAVGRFLSPDPIIPNPLNSQDFNRYSYCINNPLKYVDLSGMDFTPKSCGYKRKYKTHKGVGDSMSNKPDKDWSGFGVNGSHNRWDGFGAGWEGGGNIDLDYDPAWDYIYGNRGNFGGGGGGGKGSGGGGGGIDFTFGYGGNYNEPPRPRITFPETKLMLRLYWHYQFGRGKPFHINIADLNLPNFTRKELGIPYDIKPGYVKNVNLFKWGINGTSIPFGTIKLIYEGNDQFSIADRFNFEIHWDKGFSKRNIVTFLAGLGLFGRIDEFPIFILNPLMWQPNYFFGGKVGGEKGGFPIIFEGTITIK